jgi:hypothetical protein
MNWVRRKGKKEPLERAPEKCEKSESKKKAA